MALTSSSKYALAHARSGNREARRVESSIQYSPPRHNPATSVPAVFQSLVNLISLSFLSTQLMRKG
jgi:hypothetical protein